MFSIAKITRSTKMCRKSTRKCSSVGRKSRKPRNVDNLSRHYRQRLVNLLALRNTKTHNLPEMLTPPQSSDDDASSLMSVETCAPIFHGTTKRSPINRLKLAESRSRLSSRRMTRKFPRIEQRVPQKFDDMLEQPQFQQNAAQTPAMQHFAISYGTAAPVPIFDFNSYAALTTMQQRHQYNAEYERVYDEYYQVQQRIEKIQSDYLLFTQRLQRVPQGSTVYQHLKEHIENVYQRKSSEETNKSQYLYNQLLHLRKLMTGYDATPAPTSKSATERLAAAARDYLQRHQPNEFRSAAEISSMPRNGNFCNALQFPMFRLTVDNLKLHDKQQELAEIQLNHLDKNSIPNNVWNVVPESRMDVADFNDGESTDTASTYSESKRSADFGNGESTDRNSTDNESKNKDSMGRGSVVNDSIHSESMDEDSNYSESTDTDPSYRESSQGYSSYGSRDRNTSHSE